jgi:hypothetical protein
MAIVEIGLGRHAAAPLTSIIARAALLDPIRYRKDNAAGVTPGLRSHTADGPESLVRPPVRWRLSSETRQGRTT